MFGREVFECGQREHVEEYLESGSSGDCHYVTGLDVGGEDNQEEKGSEDHENGKHKGHFTGESTEKDFGKESG